tara:strand:+ start:27351 stop:27620 length:270 start_codon:yes stop_codon:yes gene_type:complete
MSNHRIRDIDTQIQSLTARVEELEREKAALLQPAGQRVMVRRSTYGIVPHNLKEEPGVLVGWETEGTAKVQFDDGREELVGRFLIRCVE